MIDACSPLRRFTANLANHDDAMPLLNWVEDWYPAAGQGVVAGLLDTSVDEKIPDLVNANLEIRNFAGCEKANPEMGEHGTYSAVTLIGQGRYQIRGIAPQSRLLVAKVVEPDGVATPRAVVEAIDWIVSSGAQIVVLPLGEPIERKEITRQIKQSTEHGVIFFAAAGNGYPNPLVFPARHPFAIAVGATDARGILLPDCSRKPRLDLLAPGWKIAAPVRGRVIRRCSGSSVACVIAAGVAILALSAGAIPAQSMSRTSFIRVLRGRGSARSPP